MQKLNARNDCEIDNPTYLIYVVHLNGYKKVEYFDMFVLHLNSIV